MNARRISRRLRLLVLERDFNTCRYCGYSPPTEMVDALGRRSTTYKMHVDHVTPVSQGGTSDLDNLVAACAACNLEKYDNAWKPCPLELM